MTARPVQLPSPAGAARRSAAAREGWEGRRLPPGTPRCSRCNSSRRPLRPGTKWCDRCAERCKERELARRANKVAAPVPPPPRRLPVVAGEWASQFRDLRLGQTANRRDCLNYERCLRAYRGTGDATCPDPCARWEPPAPGARATAYLSPDGGARGGA